MECSLFRVVVQPMLVFVYQLSGQPNGSSSKVQAPSLEDDTDKLYRNVDKYCQHTVHNNPEERKPQLRICLEELWANLLEVRVNVFSAEIRM
jgi:hypothetical protein